MIRTRTRVSFSAIAARKIRHRHAHHQWAVDLYRHDDGAFWNDGRGHPRCVRANLRLYATSGATLDLRSFDQIIGSLAGTGTVTNNGMGAATLAIGNDNTNTIIGGTIANGSGIYVSSTPRGQSRM